MLRTAGKQTQFKANQTQYKPNSLDAQMNVSSVKTKDYNNKQRTMNNERLCKTNPIANTSLTKNPIFPTQTAFVANA